MKELIAASGIILVIIVLCVITLTFTENLCNDITEKLNECCDKISLADWDGANKILNEAHKIYDDNTPLLKMFLNHRDLFEIQNMFVKITTSLSIKNGEMGLLEINTLISNFETLSLSEKLTIPNLI